MKSSQLVLALAFLCAIAYCHGQGTAILGHFGSANPTNEGFSLLSYGSSSLAPVVNDLGYDAWSIGVNSGTDIAQYQQTLTSQQSAGLATDWTLSLILRVGGPVNPENSGILADLFTGTEYFLLYFGSSSNGDPAVELANHSQYVLSGTGSGYHNYQLRYDTATDLASLWADGTPWVTGIQGATSLNAASLYWGIGQRNSPSSYYANWNEVSLWAIPEPSAISLFFLGSGILFYLRRKFHR